MQKIDSHANKKAFVRSLFGGWREEDVEKALEYRDFLMENIVAVPLEKRAAYIHERRVRIFGE